MVKSRRTDPKSKILGITLWKSNRPGFRLIEYDGWPNMRLNADQKAGQKNRAHLLGCAPGFLAG